MVKISDAVKGSQECLDGCEQKVEEFKFEVHKANSFIEIIDAFSINMEEMPKRHILEYSRFSITFDECRGKLIFTELNGQIRDLELNCHE
jgi:hypothetical protein